MTQEQYENLLSEMKTFIKKEIETSQKKLKKEIEETITQKLTETNEKNHEEAKFTRKQLFKCANHLTEHHTYTQSLIQNNAQRQAESNARIASIAYSSRWWQFHKTNRYRDS